MGSRNYSRELLPSRLVCFVLQALIGAEVERKQVVAQKKRWVHGLAFFCAESTRKAPQSVRRVAIGAVLKRKQVVALACSAAVAELSAWRIIPPLS